MAKVDLFEHVKDPVNTLHLEATFRLWKALPYFSDILTKHLIDLLKDGNMFRYSVKQDINKAIKCLSPQSEKFVNNLLEQSTDDYHPIEFERALCDKFVASFLGYYTRLIEIGDMSSTPNSDEKTKKYINRLVKDAQFMITLEEGDIFTFLDTNKYEEYTYAGYTTKHNGDVICDYISYNSQDGPELFHCENTWRPVVKVSLK